MAAYVLVNIEVHDPEKFAHYRAHAPALFERHGGRYLVRGGEVHRLEGDLGLKRLIIIEFPSMEAALRCVESPEYAPLRRLRHESATADIAIVEGWTPPA